MKKPEKAKCVSVELTNGKTCIERGICLCWCCEINKTITECMAWHKQEMKDVIAIAQDLLTWCIEPDKKQIYRERLDAKIKEIEG